MITAAEAKKNTMAYCNDKIDDALARISDEIEKASKKGDNRIRIIRDYGEEMSRMIVKACRKRGYRISADCYGLIVSWK